MPSKMGSYFVTSTVIIVIFCLPPASSVASERGEKPTNMQYGLTGRLFKRVWVFPSNPWNRCLFKEELVENHTTSVSVLCSEWTQIDAAQTVWESGQMASARSQHLFVSCQVNDPGPRSGVESQRGGSCACASFNNNNNSVDDDGSRNELHYWPCQADSLQNWLPTNTSSFQALLLDNMDIQNLTGLETMSSLEFLQISNNVISHRALPRDFLCSLPSLQVLILADNFDQNGSDFRWDILRCGSSELTGPHSTLVGLLIANSRLSKIPADVFHAMPYLELLQLSQGEINHLHARSFSNLPNLKELILSNNHITYLPEGVFSGLPKLQDLYLDHNHLQQFRVSDIADLRELRHLNLEHNAIKTIDGSFSQLKKLTAVFLDFNDLQELPSQLFQNSTYVHTLQMSNNQLHHIHQNAFLGMIFLELLDLSWNNLSNSTSMKKAFGGMQLERVKVLKLHHNKITTLSDSMFYEKPYLKLRLSLLDLSFNEIQYVHQNAFDGMNNLIYLALDNNRISNLIPGTFTQHETLLYLNLNSNHLEELPSDLFSGRIGSLYLENNNFTEIPKFDQTLPLAVLSMFNNSVSAIRKQDLLRMPFLKILDLSHCNLSYIEPGSFQNQRQIEQITLHHNRLNLNFSVDTFGDLYTLGSLNLSYNKITSLEGLLTHKLRFVTTIDLSGNPIREVQDFPTREGALNGASIESLFLRECQINRVSPNAFSLFKFITYIDLSANELEEFHPFEMSTVTRNYIIVIEDNPMKCSCKMAWLKDQAYARHYRASNCTHVVSEMSVPVWNLPRSEFLCENTDSCLIQPKVCQCYVSENSGPIVYVDCSYRKLSSVPKGIPASTKKLHLEGNHFRYLSLANMIERTLVTELNLQQCGIETIEPLTLKKVPFLKTLLLDDNGLTNMTGAMFPDLYQLSFLYLHRNNISSISAKAFDSLVSLTRLTLHENKLEYLDEDVMTQISSLINLDSVTLHENPWTCPCDNGTFKGWLQDYSDHLEHLNDITCNDTAVITIPDEEFLCYDPYHVTVVRRHGSRTVAFATSSTSAGVFLVLLAILVLLYRNRTIVAVLVYNQFGYRLSREECGDWPYDALVMYDDQNRPLLRWLRDELVPTLEPQFHLCIPDRDFELGTVESEEVVKRLNMSKRSIVLLSENSLANEKLIYMFQRAYYRLSIEDSRHRILIVLLENFDLDDALHNPMYEENLKAFLATRQYLRVTAKRFWQKILYKMPPPQSQNSVGEMVAL